jgi:exodeoxyribonuclease V alpha subunit
MLWKRGFHPIREVQVLAPMRTGGALGVDSLNAELQRKLNPTPKAQMSFQRGMIGVDDKVIQLRNNYAKEVFNGELGYVLAVDPEKREIDVDFDGRTLTYRANELDELRLAYAFSIHRSQGSEFPAVLLAFDWCHFIMLKRNLLYTGVTRGRQLVQLYGSIEAVKKAAENCQIEERYSKLHDWLVKK